MKYLLTAINDYGGILEFDGPTQKDVLEQFDHQYDRSGWTISIKNLETMKVKQIKKTTR